MAQDPNNYALGVEGQPLWYIDGLDLRPNISISAPASRRGNWLWWLVALVVLWWLFRR